MPADARPVPRTTGLAGTVHYRREYRDALQRPMTGTVTITGQTRSVVGGAVIPVAAVTVQVVGGVLSVDLPPDTYRITANLRTADGVKVADTDTVTLEAAP